MAIAVVVAIVVRAFVAQAYYIPSASMVPQLRIDDRVVVSRLSYDLHSVHRPAWAHRVDCFPFVQRGQSLAYAL